MTIWDFHHHQNPQSSKQSVSVQIRQGPGNLCNGEHNRLHREQLLQNLLKMSHVTWFMWFLIHPISSGKTTDKHYLGDSKPTQLQTSRPIGSWLNLHQYHMVPNQDIVLHMMLEYSKRVESYKLVSDYSKRFLEFLDYWVMQSHLWLGFRVYLHAISRETGLGLNSLFSWIGCVSVMIESVSDIQSKTGTPEFGAGVWNKDKSNDWRLPLESAAGVTIKRVTLWQFPSVLRNGDSNGTWLTGICLRQVNLLRVFYLGLWLSRADYSGF